MVLLIRYVLKCHKVHADTLRHLRMCRLSVCEDAKNEEPCRRCEFHEHGFFFKILHFPDSLGLLLEFLSKFDVA